MVARSLSSHLRLGFLWLRVVLSTLVFTMPLASVSEATLHDTGQWSDPEHDGGDWGEATSDSYAIHMALTRGEGSPYHSYVIWWNGSNADSFGGREMGWAPVAHNYAYFPDSNFVPIRVSPPFGVNEFCSGHTSLADGRLLIAGGNDSVNATAGGRYARVWRSGATQNGDNWSNADSMHEARWYPVSVPLADGKVLLLNGITDEHHTIFGGRSDGSIPTQTVADSVKLFAPVPYGRWLPSALPDSTTDANMPHRPKWREYHSAARTESGIYGEMQVYFGGKDRDGTLLQDTWCLTRQQNMTAADFKYVWVKGPESGMPQARSQHTGVGERDSNKVYVFGGLDNSNHPLGDLKQLYWTGNTPAWRSVADSGDAPTKRYGHAAFYDEIPGPSGSLRRMILFGGDSVGANPTDNSVYEMRIETDGVAWTKMTEVDLGNGRPSARFGHAMDVDFDSDHRYWKHLSPTDSLMCHVAALFGGQTGPTTYSDEFWLLWLFDNGKIGWEKPSIGGSAPSARSHASMVFDGFQGREAETIHPGRVYVFGGENVSGAIDGDQYEFDIWGKHPAWYKWAATGTKITGHTTFLQHDSPMTERTAEVYDPSDSSWTRHSNSNLYQAGFGVSMLTPGHSTAAGRVFGMGIDNKAYYLDVASSGSGSTGWNPYTYGDLGFGCEAMVMYRPGLIMASSGIDSANCFVGRTMKFDAEHASNGWQPAAYSAKGGSLTPRRYHNTVIMPDGKVIAIGGLRALKQGAYAYTTHYPQIWDPDGDGGKGAWTDSCQLAVQERIRDYHSTAILLPDARILSAGGESRGTASEDGYYADLYSPPYLFNGDALATRPTLVAATGRWRYNQPVTFAVSGDTVIRNACLIRAPSTTHAFDQSQRYVPLTLSSSAARYDGKRQYFLTAPVDSFIAPPGDYMLFASDSFGVPSIAQWVRVGHVESGMLDTAEPDSFSINIAFVGCNSLGVDWTAPGNNGSTGTALDYDIRCSTSPIDAGNISAATRIDGVAIPQLAGSVQSGSIAGLSQCTWYYFGGKARDGAGNWSPVGTGKGKTRCGYCVDPGDEMRATPGGALAMSSRSGSSSDVGGLRSFAVPTALSSEGSTLRLVAEFAKGLTSSWRISYRDFAGDSALLSGTLGQLLVEDPVTGGWQTRSTFTPDAGLLAVRSLSKDGRIVFPSGASLTAAEASPIGFRCEQAHHSRLGNLLGSGSALDSVSIEAAQNDTLDLVYAPDSTSEGGEDCFLHVLVPAGADQTHARSLRTPGTTTLDLPVSFALYPARPNPFSRQTTIRFDLPRPARVQIELFDIQGRRMATLTNQSREAGRHSVTWNGMTDSGMRAAAGIYLCRMRAGEFTAEKRISLLP